MIRVVTWLMSLFIGGLVSVGLAYGALYWWFHKGTHVDFSANQQFHIESLDSMDPEFARLFEVRRGMSRNAIARTLEELEWIDSAQLNQIGFRLFMGSAAIQAGVYAVHHGDTPAQIWQRITQGQQHLFSITFVEGSEFRHWQAQLAEHPFIHSELFDADIQAVMEILGSDLSHPEGLLFPDTYRFFAWTTDRRIYQQAYQRMQSILMEAWEERDRSVPLESPYEALILASIVERETGAAHERGLVASVFVNRLHTGMRLQSDPTIIYGLGDRYRGVIYRSDIQEHTPWNTYRIHGLPPTPIAMPGRAAIRATLQPDASDYFYFVSRNDGTHVFSRTLAEHNRAVQTYQRNR